MEASPVTPTALSRAVEISVPYASQLLNGVRIPDWDMAVKVYVATGVALGPLKGATDRQLSAIRQVAAA